MSDYPVRVSVAPDEGQNRLWGIPILGIIVRSIMVIPQAIILLVVGFVVWVLTLVSWIPVLLNGRMAGWYYEVAGGYLRLSARMSLYVALVTGRYPPFGLTGDHSVNVEFDTSEEQNRLWGIPIVGLFVRWILLIPHFIVLWFFAIGVAFITLFSWVPILLNGRQADSVVRIVGGFYRWTLRVGAYALLLTGRYPPFGLD
jgi:hypothetical protein